MAEGTGKPSKPFLLLTLCEVVGRLCSIELRPQKACEHSAGDSKSFKSLRECAAYPTDGGPSSAAVSMLAQFRKYNSIT